MKRCVCGNTVFACRQRLTIVEKVNFDFDRNRATSFVEDDSIEVETESRPIGPLYCINCGKEYATEEDIPGSK